MARISFESRQQIARFHNPLKKGQLDDQSIEVRFDPLTGHQSILNAALEDKVSIMFPDTDEAYLRERVEESRKRCFLCDEKWRQMTPTYAQSLLEDGRLTKGEAALFPNLFPISAYHAVVMVGNRHHRPLDDFPSALLEDALEVSLEFFRRCYKEDPQTLYFTINANYLLPAGASVVHPHFQLLGGPFPSTHHRVLLTESRKYLQEKGSVYWSDLVETEKELGMRWIGETGSVQWLAAFSPVGVHEVQAVWPESRHFLEWGPKEIQGAAEGLSNVLRAYHSMRMSTFNFSCFSAPVDGSEDAFRCVLRLVNRQNVIPHPRTDDYYLQKLLNDEVVIRRPEQLASLIRSYF